MLCSFAQVEKNNLVDLQSLEKKLNKTLLAFSCKDFDIASLSDAELEEIKKFENDHAVVLVAVK